MKFKLGEKCMELVEKATASFSHEKQVVFAGNISYSCTECGGGCKGGCADWCGNSCHTTCRGSSM